MLQSLYLTLHCYLGFQGFRKISQLCQNIIAPAAQPSLSLVRHEAPRCGPASEQCFCLSLPWSSEAGFFYAAASFILPRTFLFTTSLFLFHAHIHTHTHREENLYVSDIQQGKDKGTELITHHLLLLRRADGSRRYVNGKGQ